MDLKEIIMDEYQEPVSVYQQALRNNLLEQNHELFEYLASFLLSLNQ